MILKKLLLATIAFSLISSASFCMNKNPYQNLLPDRIINIITELHTQFDPQDETIKKRIDYAGDILKEKIKTASDELLKEYSKIAQQPFTQKILKEESFRRDQLLAEKRQELEQQKIEQRLQQENLLKNLERNQNKRLVGEPKKQRENLSRQQEQQEKEFLGRVLQKTEQIEREQQGQERLAAERREELKRQQEEFLRQLEQEIQEQPRLKQKNFGILA